jgi:hypothetical protein
MAFKCGFFNSIDNDRLYTAEDMNNVFNLVVSNGVILKDSNSMQVVSNGNLNIAVKVGSGIFAGQWSILDADMEFVVPTPHVTNPRIDSIVVTIKTHNDYRTGTIEYLTGTPDISPKAPQIKYHEPWRGYEVCQYRLANILVNPNAREITQADITDTRPTGECGIVTNLLQDSDITSIYEQWHEQFNQWFYNIKDTLASSTLIRSFTSTYTTTAQTETVIPIGIPEYKSVLDILQVYINGLLCFEGIDYTLDSFNNVILTKPVSKGAQIFFIVYKSMDGSGIDKFIEDVDDLIARQDEVEADFSALESSNASFKTSVNNQINTMNSSITSVNNKANNNATNITALNTEITNLKKAPTALWTGANTMGDGQTITPSKKLSACKNGWILIWCGYNTTDGIATNTRFNSVVVPKVLLDSIPANYMPFYCNLAHNVYNSGNVEYNAKMVQIYDDKIVGFAVNVATDAGKGFCLKQVIEF